MRIEPIDTFTSRAAIIARQELIALYNELSRKIVAESNYLENLGENLKQLEGEQARNAALFELFRRHGGLR